MLDAGCGTGEHALMAAGLGLDASGVDLAANAIATAERKARDSALTARFLLWDAPRLDSLRSVVPPGGRCFMLCFSDRQQGEWGRVQKLRREEITAAFAEGWRADSIAPSAIEINADPGSVRAWLVALTRI